MAENSLATNEPIVVEKLALTPAEFKKNYLFKNKPVVITNASEHWKARGKFTPEFFKKNYADVEIKIDQVIYKLGDYIDLMLSSTPEKPAPYPCKLQLTPKYADLIANVSPRFDHCLPDRTSSKIIPKQFFSGVDTYEIFFGGPGGWFPYIHYDVLKLHAIVTQLYGDKQFTVWRPNETPNMYVNPASRWRSTVEHYWEPDYQKYPLFKNATSASVVVNAGETMFVPCGWWHTARSLTPTISVAFDLLNDSNWAQFTDEIADMSRKTKPMKALAAKTFLTAEGVLFKVMEALKV